MNFIKYTITALFILLAIGILYLLTILLQDLPEISFEQYFKKEISMQCDTVLEGDNFLIKRTEYVDAGNQEHVKIFKREEKIVAGNLKASNRITDGRQVSYWDDGTEPVTVEVSEEDFLGYKNLIIEDNPLTRTLRENFENNTTCEYWDVDDSVFEITNYF